MRRHSRPRRCRSLERRELDGLHRQLGELVASGDPARYALANEGFHGAIYAGSHNGYLAELTLTTRARLAPFRRAQFRQHRPARRILR